MISNDTGLYDMFGEPIYLNDILYNPQAQNLWLVVKKNDKVMIYLYGDESNYSCTLAEPDIYAICSYIWLKNYDGIRQAMKQQTELFKQIDSMMKLKTAGETQNENKV